MESPSKIYYRRNLPHWHPTGRSIFLTWRLHGSLPRAVIDQLRIIRQQVTKKTERFAGRTKDARLIEYKRLFARVDSILDKASAGPLWLKKPEIAGLVQEALLERYAHLYVLWAYVVMANHLHVLLKPRNSEISVGTITQHLKGFTVKEANRILGRTGLAFWQDESFDHWPRDREEFDRIVDYIENNPVKAGLVKRSEDWIWSSSAERQRRGWEDLRALT